RPSSCAVDTAITAIPASAGDPCGPVVRRLPPAVHDDLARRAPVLDERVRLAQRLETDRGEGPGRRRADAALADEVGHPVPAAVLLDHVGGPPEERKSVGWGEG